MSRPTLTACLMYRNHTTYSTHRPLNPRTTTGRRSPTAAALSLHRMSFRRPSSRMMISTPWFGSWSASETWIWPSSVRQSFSPESRFRIFRQLRRRYAKSEDGLIIRGRLAWTTPTPNHFRVRSSFGWSPPSTESLRPVWPMLIQYRLPILIQYGLPSCHHCIRPSLCFSRCRHVPSLVLMLAVHLLPLFVRQQQTFSSGHLQMSLALMVRTFLVSFNGLISSLARKLTSLAVIRM